MTIISFHFFNTIMEKFISILYNYQHSFWTKHSQTTLIEIEEKIFKALQVPYRGYFVPIGPLVGDDDCIWTISMNEKSPNTPLVLLHGFAGGAAFWSVNIDDLAKDRPVYAIDLLGFGRSSRPNFSGDRLKAEEQLVESIEEWRKSVGLDKFIMLGHSLGGFLSTCYAMKYPQHVMHLILEDPWAFCKKPKSHAPRMLMRIINYVYMQFYPLAIIRAAGPLGPWVVKKMWYNSMTPNYGRKIGDRGIILDYAYQLNTQKPSGEVVFYNMVEEFTFPGAFPKDALIDRIDDLDPTIPITTILGIRSWIENSVGNEIKERRPHSYVRVEIISEAGHVVNADQPDVFNKIVNEACAFTDRSLERRPTH